MASASHAPLRASVKRSSMEAMRLTSRRLRPESAMLAARKAGSKLCSFSGTGAGSSMAPAPRRLLFGLLLAVFRRLATHGARLPNLAALEVDLPVERLFTPLVGRHNHGLHGAQHAFADRGVFAVGIVDAHGLHVA